MNRLFLCSLIPFALTACGGSDAESDLDVGSSTTLLAEEMAGDHPACVRPHRDLEAADTDGDGVLSDEEREAFKAARRAAILEEFDADGDGTLSTEEREAARTARREARFAELDADDDGLLSTDEVADACRLEHNFDRLDTDDDGFISRDEFLVERWGRFGRRRGPKS